MAAPTVLTSLILAAAFTRLWEPAGGVELNYSPGPRPYYSSLNEDKPAYAVLGPLDHPWAEGIATKSPTPPAALRLDRCRHGKIHFSYGKLASEPHAWIWTPTQLLWQARGAQDHYVDLIEWSYARFVAEAGNPASLPRTYFR